MDLDDSDPNVDRRTSWIKAKYTFYANRCVRTQGMMWKQLTRKAHDRIADRVMSLLGLPNRSAPIDTPFAVLDWACGCGVTLNYFRSKMEAMGVPFRGVGVDLIAEAVRFARTNFSSPAVLFCQADGTDLHWLPPQYFDVITSFGGFLHLPRTKLCPTVRQAFHLLKPGGAMWAGYIDDEGTARELMKCGVDEWDCGCQGAAVDVTLLRENEWFKGVGVPQANRKRKPLSVVWERPPLC
jgi:2-polyprenyl-3-methyl-5-hydroxy-6-metoxy-1,4-benzoquinol methylase